MKLTLRWFGEADTVSLQAIKQIPVVTGIVGTLEGKTDSEIWSLEDFVAYKQQVESYGLSLDVIESIPVAEAIKKGTSERDHNCSLCFTVLHLHSYIWLHNSMTSL